MAKSAAKLKKVFTNRIGMRFRWIPAGSFTMGDSMEKSRREESIRAHEVLLSCPYFLAQTPVTRAQWSRVMDTTPWDEDGPDTGTPEHPATELSYADAVAFCERLSASSRLNYRLPTEAEWERAARAGSDDEYFFGDDEKQLSQYAWYSENSGGDMHPVAHKIPNPWELFDVHGLVLEWCSDDWSYRHSEQPVDPIVCNGDLRRVVKGGSWVSKYYKCAPYYRYGVHADWRLSSVGFRPLLEASSVEGILNKRLTRRRLAVSKVSG